jgi:hypothetical protein
VRIRFLDFSVALGARMNWPMFCSLQNPSSICFSSQIPTFYAACQITVVSSSNAFSHPYLRGVWAWIYANKILVLPLEDDQADDGVLVTLLREEFYENERVDRPAPGGFTVHASTPLPVLLGLVLDGEICKCQQQREDKDIGRIRDQPSALPTPGPSILTAPETLLLGATSFCLTWMRVAGGNRKFGLFGCVGGEVVVAGGRDGCGGGGSDWPVGQDWSLSNSPGQEGFVCLSAMKGLLSGPTGYHNQDRRLSFAVRTDLLMLDAATTAPSLALDKLHSVAGWRLIQVQVPVQNQEYRTITQAWLQHGFATRRATGALGWVCGVLARISKAAAASRR